MNFAFMDVVIHVLIVLWIFSIFKVILKSIEQVMYKIKDRFWANAFFLLIHLLLALALAGVEILSMPAIKSKSTSRYKVVLEILIFYKILLYFVQIKIKQQYPREKQG